MRTSTLVNTLRGLTDPGLPPPRVLAKTKPPQFKAAPVLMLLGFLFPSATFGEINATQGVTNVSKGEFHSPMVLDAPFPLTDREQWGADQGSGGDTFNTKDLKPVIGLFTSNPGTGAHSGNWSDSAILKELRDYRCDGLTILQMQMRGDLHRDGNLEVQVKGKIDAIKGHDKLVNMKFDFING